MSIEYLPSNGRLFAAADALLSAMEVKDGQARVVMTLDRATIKRLSSTTHFTPDELGVAMQLLVRMGFVQALANE